MTQASNSDFQIIAHANQEPVTITPEGGERRILSRGGGMMLVEFRFKAGVVGTIHSHPHEQLGYVVSGSIDLIMEGHENQRLEAGSSYYVQPNVRHGIIVHSDAVLIDAFTPQREDFLA
jgi:quercetin dioxygenase-like cupin family protein